MEINVKDDKKLVEIWLTNAEKNDAALRNSLKSIYSSYSEKKYTVAVFESGHGDLYQSALALLKHNKKRSAELIA